MVLLFTPVIKVSVSDTVVYSLGLALVSCAQSGSVSCGGRVDKAGGSRSRRHGGAGAGGCPVERRDDGLPGYSWRV